MDKSEKSFYVIIENKKCGKFSGASPIQVAKKVASKKLKLGKKMEITFYLDEVGGKKKRYGPYRGVKDKKTVSVVKKGKIMKGGVLTVDMKRHIKGIFENNCQYTASIETIIYNYTKIIYLPRDFSFGGEPLIFFNPLQVNTNSVNTNSVNTVSYNRSPVSGRISQVLTRPPTLTPQQNQYEYKYAVFKETNGRNIWILLRNPSLLGEILFINFVDFFLNPDNLQYFNNRDDKKIILDHLRYCHISPSRTICEEAEKIYNFLYVHPTQNSEKVFIYVPDYSHPKIQKCVYRGSDSKDDSTYNLTFGILDEENVGVIPRNSSIPNPTSLFQKFLIMKQSLIGGLSEPIIYVRVPLQQSQQPQQSQQSLFFTHCIYTESLTSKNLKIAVLNNNNTQISNFNNNTQIDIKLCNILLQIPREMGKLELERIRVIAKTIIDLKYRLPPREFKQQLQFNNDEHRNNQIKQLEPQLAKLQSLLPQLLPQSNQLEQQLAKLQSLLPQLPPQSNQLEQQLAKLQSQLHQQQQQQIKKLLFELKTLIDSHSTHNVTRTTNEYGTESLHIQNLEKQIKQLKQQLQPRQRFPSSNI